MIIKAGGSGAVKKLFILALLVLGGLAVWRKIQAQRADLDLWSEATAADDY
jgi:MYXO-CTERM domain-containing protein